MSEIKVRASKRLQRMENVTIVPNEVLDNNSISVKARWLWCYLWRHCYGYKDTCFPSIDNIVEAANSTKKTVRKWRKELEEANLLKTKMRGPGKSNEYILFSENDPEYSKYDENENPVKSSGVKPEESTESNPVKSSGGISTNKERQNKEEQEYTQSSSNNNVSSTSNEPDQNTVSIELDDVITVWNRQVGDDLELRNSDFGIDEIHYIRKDVEKIEHLNFDVGEYLDTIDDTDDKKEVFKDFVDNII